MPTQDEGGSSAPFALEAAEAAEEGTELQTIEIRSPPRDVPETDDADIGLDSLLPYATPDTKAQREESQRGMMVVGGIVFCCLLAAHLAHALAHESAKVACGVILAVVYAESLFACFCLYKVLTAGTPVHSQSVRRRMRGYVR